jgi:hypothetical protein
MLNQLSYIEMNYKLNNDKFGFFAIILKSQQKSLIENELAITARQYGEVVLPDEASGQGPGTLARKLSRCKEGMARVFAVMVQILLSITRVAVQV